MNFKKFRIEFHFDSGFPDFGLGFEFHFWGRRVIIHILFWEFEIAWYDNH